jgi:DNA polymerase
VAQITGGAGRPDLLSTNKFAELLKALGVVVQYKTSATGNQIPALAKTDDFMNELLNHEDPRVATLAAARLGEKSTIEESRGQRLLSVATLDWSCYRPGNFLPIPLAYGRAHTHRLAGDWKMNMQNLPAGRGG